MSVAPTTHRFALDSIALAASVVEARRLAYALFIFIAAALALVLVLTLVMLTYGRYRQRVRERSARQARTTVHIDAWSESGKRQPGPISRDDEAMPSEEPD